RHDQARDAQPDVRTAARRRGAPRVHGPRQPLDVDRVHVLALRVILARDLSDPTAEVLPPLAVDVLDREREHLLAPLQPAVVHLGHALAVDLELERAAALLVDVPCAALDPDGRLDLDVAVIVLVERVHALELEVAPAVIDVELRLTGEGAAHGVLLRSSRGGRTRPGAARAPRCT